MSSAQSFADRWAELEALADRERSYSDRATRIIDRIWPRSKRSIHGFYEPEAFFARLQFGFERKALWYSIKAILRAKAEGGPPRIQLPRGSRVDFSTGPMGAASRYFEAAFPDGQH